MKRCNILRFLVRKVIFETLNYSSTLYSPKCLTTQVKEASDPCLIVRFGN